MAEVIPVLGEHQALGQGMNSTEPAEYTPSEAERKAIALVNKLFAKAKSYRQQYDQHWMDYYRMFRGKQWKEQRPSYRHSEVINKIFQTIQSVVPVMTDARQRFEYLAQDPSDMEFAKILDEVAESDWQRQNWTFKLAEIIFDGHFYGTGLSECGYDGKARYNQGQITLDSLDPFYFFPDPDARDCNERASFMIYAEPIEVSKLKREYPEKAPFIKADLIDLVQGSKTDVDVVRFRSPVDTKTIIEGTSVYDASVRDQALKMTVYLKSEEVEEEEKRSVGPDGQEVVEYEKRLKYPNGRKICVAGGVLLHDGPNPFDDGLFPYARLVNYIDPRTFWGISEIEQLQSPQKIYNKLISFALDVLTLMGNPIWICDDTAGIDTDNLVNRPGLVVEKTPGTEVRREEGVQLQPYVLQLAETMRNSVDEIAGSQEVSRGVRPEGITAASAIASLQEAAQTRIRQKSRNLDAFLQSVGQLYKNRVFQFYTTPQIIRVTNDQAASKYFKFHVQNEQQPDGSTVRKAYVRDYVQNPETGHYSETLETREFILRGDFDVKVSTGSSLPFAKDVKFNRARQMYLDGVFDEEEYLKAADIPNWQPILERVMQKKQAEAQAQMAAKGAPQAVPA